MKRYERMTKEEIIEAFKETDWCDNCRFTNKSSRNVNCCDVMANYLNEEIKMKIVPRWQTIKSDEDLEKMREDFCSSVCSQRPCGNCSYAARLVGACFANYLLEEIEVEETV